MASGSAASSASASRWSRKPGPRGRACAYVALGWQAGVLVAALVTPLLLPQIGWRGMFLVGPVHLDRR
jgi:MFS family permease